jgi:hypothetical protein
MNISYLLSTKNNNDPDDITRGSKISDILKMSQDISGGWIKDEADRRVVIQEQIEKKKDQAPVKKKSSRKK